ncbi:hypothetical protein HID58_006270 [Brassica napus]|uniref:Uncharacterized protein n=1 Tax=Brassica napus TaxID=3708 RepID=A0ABQ7ZGL3_BRANA|nr:hypothetical protein HID58_066705 [Brassica napus]KAH0908246.1 hypothetical protein HID58_031567 [Brassica napus]KAH0938809.1 hypothetical protein HID58_006270 [Brassica napus]
MVIFDWDPGVNGNRLDLYHYDKIGGGWNHKEELESRVLEGKHGFDGIQNRRGLQWAEIFTRSEEEIWFTEYQLRDLRGMRLTFLILGSSLINLADSEITSLYHAGRVLDIGIWARNHIDGERGEPREEGEVGGVARVQRGLRNVEKPTLSLVTQVATRESNGKTNSIDASAIAMEKEGELVEKMETSKMVTSLDKTEEVMGHGVGDDVTETMKFNGSEIDVKGKEEATADEDEFQALTDGEVETVQEDTRDPMDVENEQGGIGDQRVQAEDDEKKKGTRKALFKKTTAIAVGTSKMRFVQAVLSPRKNAHAKPGKRQGGGDGARQTEDKEVLWSDKWWGWGVFLSFLSISSMSIFLLLGVGVLWHCFGRWGYVFLVLLVLVLCWNKLGAFIFSIISSRPWLIGTVSLLVMHWFIWTLRFWVLDVTQVLGIPKIGYGRSGQMGSLVSSNRRLPYQALVEFGMGVQQRVFGHKDFSGFGYGAQKWKYYGGKLVLGISRWITAMGGD